MAFIDFTVVIPTYNGELRLPVVIDQLLHQTRVENLNWEIIVVDNNSTDATARVIHEYQQSWSYPFQLKYIFEAEQGAAFARSKGILEARGEIVGFLDDDNLPAHNWIIEAYKFAQEHPQAGAWASQIHGNFEVEPPESFKPILFYLAITERGDKPHIYEACKKGFPPSAGLVVRRNVWRDNVPIRLFLIGRVGSSMLGSEDAESLLYIHKAGWEIWYNPAMVVSHIIPSWRLEKNYLISLMHGVGLARYYLRMQLLTSWQRPLVFLMYFINDIRKAILHFIVYRRVLKSDIVAACEMKRLIATVISPFYLCKMAFKKWLFSTYNAEFLKHQNSNLKSRLEA
nr:hormogonium polysaccharide biosynthesis glycosyltransferase HpsE [Nostoc sp. DedQUE03]MDZ7972834.1 hormogonium polysaccharide biosynthesis glycosyltransferase HpsE [Nostoc sp. DedQUE03]MDZ8045252.1 hormogonium polysaccharide biosynthesis glycosyltransferase HpsE [Nostoc sp. DedQUE02]